MTSLFEMMDVYSAIVYNGRWAAGARKDMNNTYDIFFQEYTSGDDFEFMGAFERNDSSQPVQIIFDSLGVKPAEQ